jgi:hypothetical protein
MKSQLNRLNAAGSEIIKTLLADKTMLGFASKITSLNPV